MPLFPLLPFQYYKSCPLHGRLCIGRVGCQFIHNIGTSNDSQVWWGGLHVITEGLGINVDFSKAPTNGSWHIKGKHAAILISQWPKIAQYLGPKATKTIEPMSKVEALLKIANLAPHELNHRPELIEWYKSNSVSGIDEFMKAFTENLRDLNYTHEIAYEWPQILEHMDGLSLYSNDSQETMNYIAKCDFNFSNRGGSTQGTDWMLTIMQRSFMRLHTILSYCPEELESIISDQLKKYQDDKE